MALEPPAADALPAVLVPPPGPNSRAWLQHLQRVESPNVTAVGGEFPVVWHSARGAAVRDVDGNTYIDATSAFGVAFVGHAHPAVVEAAQRQTGLLPHAMGDVHPPAVRIALLEALQQRLPAGLGHALLCTSGAEAVECALATALLATGKHGVVAFHGGYHGLLAGAREVTARRDFRDPLREVLSRRTTFVPFPDPAAVPVGVDPAAVVDHALFRVEEALSGPVAGGLPAGAVLVEPVQGRGGCRVPPDGFLRGLRRICDRHGALLVFDEVFTGCGRTGLWWAGEHERVVPDVMALGKALGGGFPVAACVGRADVMAAWGVSRGEALHTSTFLGHPVAMAAAMATLQVIAHERLVERADALGRRLLADLGARLAGLPAVADVRGKGLLLGVALRDPAQGWTAPELAQRVVIEALRHGVIALPAGAGVVELAPPAVMTDDQAAVVVDVLGRAVTAATES
jgi:4-aminobutyrate aminotransferase-like enzyme